MALVIVCFVLPPCFLLLLPLAWLELNGNWRGVLPVTLSAFLTAYGLFALFAQVGCLHLVSESFEWPILSAIGTVENSRGQRFVPILSAPGRVQVYDREGEFLRGWLVPSSDSIFKLHVSQDDNLEVFTARGNLHLIYAADGTLLDESTYHGDYDRRPSGPTCLFERRSAWYLLPFASWSLALLLFASGLAGVGLMFNHPRLKPGASSPTARYAQTPTVFSKASDKSSTVDDVGEELASAQVSVSGNDSNLRSESRQTAWAATDFECLQNPPPGAWCQQTVEGFSLGAFTRSPAALVFVPFTCIVFFVTFGLIYGTQVISGEFRPHTLIAGIPLIIFSVIFGKNALMMVCGKIVVTVNKDKGTFFEGIGLWGRTRFFDWSEIAAIRQEGNCRHYMRADNGGIVLEGTRRLCFGMNLTEKRRAFVLNALRYLKATDSQGIREHGPDSSG